MKKLFFSITVISFMMLILLKNGYSQTTIPNAGFENWTNANTAVSWNSVSLLTLFSLSRSTDSHSGTYAAQMKSQTILSYSIPGITALGNINLTTQQVSGGTPFVGKPAIFKGFYKYTPVGNDSMLIAIILTKTTSGVRDTVGGGIFTNKNAVNTYTEFNIPLLYNQSVSGDPDTMNIVLLSSAVYPGGNGTTLLVDDLSLYYSTDIEKNQSDFDIKIFPNPANDILTVYCKNNNANSNQIIIYNIAGQEVYKNSFNASQFKISIADFMEGVYFVKIFNDRNHKIQKLIVKHNNE